MIRTVPRKERLGRSSLRSRLAGAGLALVLATASVIAIGPAASAVEQPFSVTDPQNNSSVGSTTPTFTGIGTTGNTVTLTYSGQQLLNYTAGSAVVDDAGNWSTPTSFAQANPGETSTRVRVTETDPAGVETGTFFVTVNFPEAPVTAAVFTLESPLDGETRDDFLNIVHFVGTGNVGNTVTVRYFDGRGGLAVAGIGEVDQNGRFDVFATFRDLPAGQTFANTFTLQTTPGGDRVSNEIGRTINFATAPVELAPFVVISPESGSTVDSLTPAFTGTGAPGDTVTLSYGGQELGTYIAGTATIDQNGDWTVPATDFSDANFGATEIRVVAAATDPAGVERPGARFVDIVLPQAPAQQIDFTLTSPEEGAVIENPRAGVPYIGTGEPGNTIVVQYFNGRGGLSDAGSATVEDDGTFEVTALFTDLPAGQLFANTFTQQEDADGERVAGEIGRTISFVNAPVVSALAAPTLDAPVVTGTTVTFSGTGVAGATVEVSIADGTVASAALADGAVVTATVGTDGTWTASGTFEAGSYSATATQFTGDAADRSAPSAARDFTVSAVVTPPTGNGAVVTPGGLAATGGSANVGALVLAMLLVTGGAALMITRRVRVSAQR